MSGPPDHAAGGHRGCRNDRQPSRFGSRRIGAARRESRPRLGIDGPVVRAAGAGIDPVVIVSGLEEDAIVAGLSDATEAEIVSALATAKADAVIGRAAAAHPDAIVIGCDSMLLVDGVLVGKPHTRQAARQRWHAQSGHVGDLLTGHAVVRIRAGVPVARAVGTAVTTVHFAAPTSGELDAYLDSGEPLESPVPSPSTDSEAGSWTGSRATRRA